MLGSLGYIIPILFRIISLLEIVHRVGKFVGRSPDVARHVLYIRRQGHEVRINPSGVHCIAEAARRTGLRNDFQAIVAGRQRHRLLQIENHRLVVQIAHKGPVGVYRFIVEKRFVLFVHPAPVVAVFQLHDVNAVRREAVALGGFQIDAVLRILVAPHLDVGLANVFD